MISINLCTQGLCKLRRFPGAVAASVQYCTGANLILSLPVAAKIGEWRWQIHLMLAPPRPFHVCAYHSNIAAVRAERLLWRINNNKQLNRLTLDLQRIAFIVCNQLNRSCSRPLLQDSARLLPDAGAITVAAPA